MKYLLAFLKALKPPTDPEWWGRAIVGGLFFVIGAKLLGFSENLATFSGWFCIIAAANSWRDK